MFAQAYPNRPVRVIIPYPPAGGENVDGDLSAAGSPEIARLVGVAQAVLGQEAHSR